MASDCHKNVDCVLIPPTHGNYKEYNRKDVPTKYSEAQLRDLFKSHDINRDGVLSKQELRNAFYSLGARFLAPDWRAFRAIWHADANGDGKISESELDNVVSYAFQLGYTIK